VSDFKTLKVWRKAHALALNVHRVAARLRGSEYHLIVARDFGAINRTDFDSVSSQTIEVRKMLYGLLRALITQRPRVAATESQGVVN
jgi:hypothetical protein